MPRCALFLDRDGVLVEDVHFLKSVDQIELVKESIEPLRELQQRYLLLVVTNQSGVARGYFDEPSVHTINREVTARLADHGVGIDGVYYCPHHPEGSVAAYRRSCACRKPAPGMLLQAAADWQLDLPSSCMVGDRPSDLEAGRAAGARAFLLPPETRADAWVRLSNFLS
jgi:D-glycero-D-manno-heptose 1,7-bisphosphate phosphatase